MLKNFDLKYFALALALIGVFVLTHIYYNRVLNCLKCVLEFPYLNLYAGGLATIFTVLQKIKTRKISFKANMSFKDFQESMSDIISFIDNPVITICSLALAKGLFLQQTEGIIYYPFFNKLEITFIFLVTLYLLYSSLMEIWRNIKETCWSEPIVLENPQASLETETKDKAIPNPEL